MLAGLKGDWRSLSLGSFMSIHRAFPPRPQVRRLLAPLEGVKRHHWSYLTHAITYRMRRCSASASSSATGELPHFRRPYDCGEAGKLAQAPPCRDARSAEHRRMRVLMRLRYAPMMALDAFEERGEHRPPCSRAGKRDDIRHEIDRRGRASPP